VIKVEVHESSLWHLRELVGHAREPGIPAINCHKSRCFGALTGTRTSSSKRAGERGDWEVSEKNFGRRRRFRRSRSLEEVRVLLLAVDGGGNNVRLLRQKNFLQGACFAVAYQSAQWSMQWIFGI